MPKSLLVAVAAAVAASPFRNKKKGTHIRAHARTYSCKTNKNGHTYQPPNSNVLPWDMSTKGKRWRQRRRKTVKSPNALRLKKWKSRRNFLSIIDLLAPLNVCYFFYCYVCENHIDFLRANIQSVSCLGNLLEREMKREWIEYKMEFYKISLSLCLSLSLFFLPTQFRYDASILKNWVISFASIWFAVFSRCNRPLF